MIDVDLPEPDGKQVTVGAHTVHYIDLGEGRPTVFLHGGGPGCSGWTDFGTVADAFASDRRVLLMDLLHFGRSSMEPFTAPRWSYHAQVVAGALDAIGIENADFVCNSVGGSTAIALAAERPDLVGRLVLTGSEPVPGAVPMTPWHGERGRTAYTRYYDEDGGPTREKLLEIIAELEWTGADAVPSWTYDLRWELSTRPELVALGGDWSPAGGRGIAQDLGAHLGLVAAPTLLLWGAVDAFATPAYALELAQRLPEASLHVMAGGAHHMEEELPAPYTALVKAFLDS